MLRSFCFKCFQQNEHSYSLEIWLETVPFMPSGAFNICCPRDCVSRHNGVTSGAPLKPLRVDSALRALSTLRGLRGHPRWPHYAERRQSLGQQMLERWAKMGWIKSNNPCTDISPRQNSPRHRSGARRRSAASWGCRAWRCRTWTAGRTRLRDIFIYLHIDAH